MKALLIIDMQLGSFSPYSTRFDTIGTVDRINKLAEFFRENKDLVIFIQHDGTRENCFIPGSRDWKILPELSKETSDMIISKTANDAFYKTNLEEVLKKNEITELYFTGCATDFCIDTTIKSALSKDYRITVAEDGHTTADRPHINAQTVIKHYNWLWDDQTPTKYKITVVKTSELLKLK